MSNIEGIELPDGESCEAWFGACYSDDVPNEADVSFLSSSDGIVHLFSVGDLTTRAQCSLARLIHKHTLDSRTKVIVLNLASWAGEVAGMLRLVPLIESAKASKTVVAHLHNGCGVAYHLATFCDQIWATPHHQIGYFGYGLPDAQLMKKLIPTFCTANRLSLSALLQGRPHANVDAARRLFYSSESGEAAELHGLVDGLNSGLLRADDLHAGENSA